MFYSETILTNKHSPIGIAWLLATLGPKNQARKISRKELIAFDLVNACEYIAEPPEPLALRTSATLLYGVAKVYNQHFEDFFTNVNTFHHTLRRTIITDFSTTGGGGTGGTRGIDLTDEGKSKIDQITFGGIDLGWQSGLDFDFGLIDWSNPLGPARKRRASSKLGSQPSQQSQDGEEEDDEEGSDDEQGVARKRARTGDSTPGLADHTRRVNSIHHPSDRITPVIDDFELPIDLQLDLGDMPDTSFSAPGEAFGDGQGDISFDNGGYYDDGFRFDDPGVDTFHDRNTPQREDREPSLDSQGQPKAPAGTKSALKKRRRGSDESAAGDEEDEAAEPVEVKKRVKKQKKVKWDQSLEISDEDERNARQRYAENMEAQRRELLAKDEEKAVQGRADEMVDSAGGWLEFFDPAMKAMFGTITKAGKWKWELDLAAQRAGKQYVPEEEREPERDEPRFGDDEERVQPVDDYNDYGRDQYGDGPDYNDGQYDQGGYVDMFHDTMEDVNPNSKPRRSQSTDVEIGRRASQSSQVKLPWHDNNRDVDDDDFHDAPDSGFTPGSLHFSAMTPQEARLRLYSRSKSGTGSRIPGMTGQRGRSRSGSVLEGRATGPAAMLADGPEDESLPAQEVVDLAEEPSQFLAADVPEAFKPESLALIETQCRNFLSYVEKKMITNKTDDVDFDDVVDYKTSRKVAATAFYNCLTLATKNLLKVDQAEAFDTFSIKFTT